jgi:hypothetical protein
MTKKKTSKLKFNFKQLGNDITVYPFVEIRWQDIEGDAGWSDVKSLQKERTSYMCFKRLFTYPGKRYYKII